MREHRAAVIAGSVGELFLVRPIGIHGPQLQVVRCQRRVDHLAGLPVDGTLGVIAGRIGEALFDFARVGGQEDVVAFKDAPQVALAAIGRRGAGVGGQVRGGVDDVLVVLQKIRAGGLALAGRDQVLVRTVGVHYEDLVAPVGRSRRHEDQPLAVRRPVGLGVLPAVGKLDDPVEVRRLRAGNRNGG